MSVALESNAQCKPKFVRIGGQQLGGIIGHAGRLDRRGERIKNKDCGGLSGGAQRCRAGNSDQSIPCQRPTATFGRRSTIVSSGSSTSRLYIAANAPRNPYAAIGVRLSARLIALVIRATTSRCFVRGLSLNHMRRCRAVNNLSLAQRGTLSGSSSANRRASRRSVLFGALKERLPDTTDSAATRHSRSPSE